MRVEGFRFFFYAGDRAEPAHVHVRRGKKEAKFWLDPVGLEGNRGFAVHELNGIEKLVKEHALTLIKAWNDYFEP